MKKCFLLGIALAMSFSVKAQLVVNNTGKVGIGITNSPISEFCVGYKGSTTYPITFYSKKVALLSLSNDTIQTTNNSTAIYTDFKSRSSMFWGISLRTHANNGYAYGIKSTSYGRTPIGLFGGISTQDNSTKAVGVMGSSTSLATPNVNGFYAGFFYGDVRVTGSIYGTVLSPTASTSSRGVEIQAEGNEDEENPSVTEKLQNVSLIQMRRVNQNGSIAANKEEDRGNFIDIDRSGLSEEELMELEEMERASYQDPIQTKLSSVSYGLAADQLKEVFPDLVYEDKDGNYSVNYVEMVPLLVQSIKEL